LEGGEDEEEEEEEGEEGKKGGGGPSAWLHCGAAAGVAAAAAACVEGRWVVEKTRDESMLVLPPSSFLLDANYIAGSVTLPHAQT